MIIENYREQPPGGTVVAVFDVYLDKIGLTLRNLKVLMTKKGGHFLGYPSFKDPQNLEQWIPYMEWSGDKKKDFDAKLLEELKKTFLKGTKYEQRGFNSPEY